MEQNTWFTKFKRTLTAFFPIAQNREGTCRQCGACCSLPVECWFLKRKEDGSLYCSIYKLRPLNCRKYPRTQGECITARTCGYYFEAPVPIEENVEVPWYI